MHVRFFPFHLLFSIALLLRLLSAPTGLRAQTVGWVVTANARTAGDSAAIALLADAGMRPAPVSPDAPPPAGMRVVWIDAPDSAKYLELRSHAPRLREWYDRGIRLLLTGYAALLPHDLGIESSAPEVRAIDVRDDGIFDERGFQSYRGHPVFAGLFGGAFVLDGDADARLARIGFFDDRMPAEGRVIGVDRSYVTFHPRSRLLLEYGDSARGCIAMGAYVSLLRANTLAANLHLLLANCIRRLDGAPSAVRATYWPRSAGTPAEFAQRSAPAAASDRHPLDTRGASGLVLHRERATGNFFDLAGRRALVMGTERGGIDELWVHPFRVARNYRASIVVKGALVPLADVPCAIEARPESFTRVYALPGGGTLRETIVAATEAPGVMVQYVLRGRSPVHLVVSLGADLRWMWPYDADALGAPRWCFDAGMQAFHVRDASGDFACVFGADAKPLQTLAGMHDVAVMRDGKLAAVDTGGARVLCAAEYLLPSRGGEALTFVLAGTDRGAREADSAWRAIVRDPQALYDESAAHCSDLLASRTVVTSPDAEWNAAYLWALTGTDRFVASTPDLGTALLAGYGSSERGWDGGQKPSGRPGYAWYFGRDAEWACLALDDCGGFATVRGQLELLAKFQDPRGKILHELTTSGAVHYDAADATPLYVVLAAHHLRASGDHVFVDSLWESIQHAMDYLYTTDTDGDGLIENTPAGHGWVEGGALAGAKTELYLASLWVQALRDAAYLAGRLLKSDMRHDYARDAMRAYDTLAARFWNPVSGWFNHAIMPDGRMNTTLTALAAVPMALGLTDADHARNALTRFASNDFSTDWGTRIVGASSPLYNPAAYHQGSVWPLFTGWVACAEYAFGNATQAEALVWDNMHIMRLWALGAVQEVMNGARNAPAGVCPHQCWSETAVLEPVIAGMLGWKPDAASELATLRPRLPVDWDSIAVRRLRVGKSVLDFSMTRTRTATEYRVALVEGPPVQIGFQPLFPAGQLIRKVSINTMPVMVELTSDGQLKDPMPFFLRKTAVLRFEHNGGFGVVAARARPAVGDSSSGHRCIASDLGPVPADASEETRSRVFSMVFEGRAGTTHDFEVAVFDREPLSADGATMSPPDDHGRMKLTVAFEASDRPFVSKTVTLRMK